MKLHGSERDAWEDRARLAFSYNLRHARTARGMSRPDLERATGLTTRTIKYAEDGLRTPRAWHAVVIARALGTTVEEMFDDVEDR